MNIGDKCTVNQLTVGDCLEVLNTSSNRFLTGMLVGKSTAFYHILFPDGSTEGFHAQTCVTYKGKGKLTVEFAKQPTLEDAAKELKVILEQRNTKYYFIKIVKNSLTVYYYYINPGAPETCLGFKVNYCFISESSKILLSEDDNE